LPANPEEADEELEFKPYIPNKASPALGVNFNDSSKTNTPTFIGAQSQILAEIPGDSALNSVNRNYDLNYRPYETRDFDYVRVPKEENLLQINTDDFYEFERVYNCSRPELIHLIKGLA
jgi:hypothetical protein